MNANFFHSIIIGGGCSGLSLARALAKKETEQTILILESRTSYIPDRTWCFWNVQSHPYENLVEYKWKRWQVRFQGNSHSMQSDRYEYHMVSSSCFYSASLKEINENPRITHLTDVLVSRVSENNFDVEVESSKGVFKGNRVFDSRPKVLPCSLYQHFLGWHVISDDPIFDPEEVILMDFEVEQDKGLAFMYVLPFSAYEGLVESTYISSEVYESEVYEQNIHKYLYRQYGLTAYQILRKEKGALPLGIISNKPYSKIIPIGTRAGWMRASTGYAFLGIQEGIELLLEGKSKSKRIQRYLDRIFLSFLKDHPEKGPETFFRLFRRNDPDCLVRFMTGNGSFQETLKVISSMPKLSMLKQAFQ